MRFLCFLLLCLSCYSCYEPLEGCLDRNATNYDVDADFECAAQSCCTYPGMSIRFTPNWGADETLDTDSFYTDASNNRFRLDRLRFYVSEVELLQVTGDTVTPENLVDMGLQELSGDTVFQELNSNLALVRSQAGDSWSVGDFTAAIDANQLLMRLGLQAPYSSVIPETMTSSHPLSRQEGLLNLIDGQGYVLTKMEYSLILASEDTISREIYVFGNEALTLDLPGGIVVPGGNNLTIDLSVDYQTLLSPLDMSTDSLNLVSAIGAGLPQVVQYTSFSFSDN